MVTLRAVESSRQLTKSTQNSAPVSKARIAGLADRQSHIFSSFFLPSFLLGFFLSSPLLLLLLLLPIYLSTLFFIIIIIIAGDQTFA